MSQHHSRGATVGVKPFPQIKPCAPIDTPGSAQTSPCLNCWVGWDQFKVGLAREYVSHLDSVTILDPQVWKQRGQTPNSCKPNNTRLVMCHLRMHQVYFERTICLVLCAEILTHLYLLFLLNLKRTFSNVKKSGATKKEAVCSILCDLFFGWPSKLFLFFSFPRKSHCNVKMSIMSI